MSDATDEEERYVHRPSGEPPRKPEADEAFGLRGWVLVGVIVVSFLIVPWSLILLSSAPGTLASIGLPWRETFLVVPLVPALVLGVVGVWTALAARQG
jgi:hypothetical protein